MKIFISWSGRQAHAVALQLREWFPTVLAGRVQAFVSSEDIEKGARGLPAIAEELEKADFGVVIVTPSNQSSPWINFEAGALGKSVAKGRVAPLLVGLVDAEVVGPLKQFQNTSAIDDQAVLALVRTVNSQLPDPLPSKTVDTLFQVEWPTLADAIEAALITSETAVDPAREPADLLEEVVASIRQLQRDVADLRSGTLGFPETRTRLRTIAQRCEILLQDFDFYVDSMHVTGAEIRLFVRDSPKVTKDLSEQLQTIAVVGGVAVALVIEDGRTYILSPDGSVSVEGAGLSRTGELATPLIVDPTHLESGSS